MLTLFDLSDIPGVFSVILSFLQLTDIAILASRAFNFRENISRCIRSLILVEECCTEKEKLRASRLLKSCHNFLPCVTSDTRLQFVYISVYFNWNFGDIKTLHDLMANGSFQHVQYYVDTLDVFRKYALLEHRNLFSKTLKKESSQDCYFNSADIITECLNLQTVNVAIMPFQHFSQVNIALGRHQLLVDKMWPTLEVLTIAADIWNLSGNEGQDGAWSAVEVIQNFERIRFPSLKIVHFKGIEPEPFFQIIEWLLSIAMNHNGRGNTLSSTNNGDFYDSIWPQVEELELNMTYTSIDEDGYYSFFHMKEQWLSFFRHLNTNIDSMAIGGSTSFPSLFPGTTRIKLGGKLPCWKIMRLFERNEKQKKDTAVGGTTAKQVAHERVEMKPIAPCFADIFTPCPCVTCLALPCKHALRHGGVALTCSADDAEVSMYLSDFLQHDRLNISFLQITVRSSTTCDDETSGEEDLCSACSSSSESDDDDNDHIFSTTRKTSIYSGLFNAIERQALKSLRHLHVNESFLFLCGCFTTSTDNIFKTKSHTKHNFEENSCSVLANCPHLEVLTIDLDLISQNRSKSSHGDMISSYYVAALSTFLQECVRCFVEKGGFKQLTSINFVVKILSDFDLIFSAANIALQELSAVPAASSAGSFSPPLHHPHTPCKSSMSPDMISVKVSIASLKSCRVGYLLLVI